ncbi:hypothetical protein BH11ARM2_BH11ARM2_38000 [soil metagenome]
MESVMAAVTPNDDLMGGGNAGEEGQSEMNGDEAARQRTSQDGEAH